MESTQSSTDDADPSPPAKRSRKAYQKRRRSNALYMRVFPDDIFMENLRSSAPERLEAEPPTLNAVSEAAETSCICDSLNMEGDIESETEASNSSDNSASVKTETAVDDGSSMTDGRNTHLPGDNVRLAENNDDFAHNENSDNLAYNDEENNSTIDSSDMDFNHPSNEDENDDQNNYSDSKSSTSFDDSEQDENDSESSDRSSNFDESEDDLRQDKPFLSSEMAALTLPLIFKPGVNARDQLPILIAIAIRHHLTHEATVTILKWLNSLTEYSGLPNTKKALWSALCRDDSILTRHMYCRKCKGYMGEGKTPAKECPCTACGPGKANSSLSYFLQISLRSQLQELLAIPGIADSLQYRFTRIKKNINANEDIYDGVEYKKKCEPGAFLSSRTNFSFTLNTDGCKVSKSSNTSAWPILFQVNEFPPHERKCHMLLGGVWVDDQHPNLNTLLLPTVTELQSLYETGVTWKPDGITPVTSKFVTLVCCVDSMARSPLLRMTQFNGMYGCTFCYAPGRTLPGKGVLRVYPVERNLVCRTDHEIRTHMDQGTEQQKVYGVKGPSVLMLLQEFDLSLGVVNDSMHNLYLGVAKQHFELLLFGKANDPWYTGSPKQIALINERLLIIKPPSRISRMPRDVTKMKLWKATEFRNFLLYYCLQCLEGVVKTCYFKNLALLSRAAYILNKDSITQDEIQSARLLISQYVEGFQDLFGIENMSYNVHLLNHLTDTAENWGPLWANNAFPFESWNKRLLDSVTSATSRPLQIVTRFLMSRYVNSVTYNLTFNQKTRNFIQSILYGKSRADEHAVKVTCNMYGLGKEERRPPCDWEISALRTAGYQCQYVHLFKRAKINGCEYRCRGDKEKTRFCNKIVCNNDVRFGEIVEIVHFHCNEEHISGLFIHQFRCNGNAFQARHIHNVMTTDNVVFITVNNVSGPAILIKSPKGLCAIRLSNTWESD